MYRVAWPGVLVGLVAVLACQRVESPSMSCESTADCPSGMVCDHGACQDGCHSNADCPEGQVCMVETGLCGGGGAGDSDSDADSDADADIDGDADGDTDTDTDGCPPPGTTPCMHVGQCGDPPVDCACPDLLGLGGYCYPDCSDCQAPYQCLGGGCLFVTDLHWDFDLQVIDPEVGGGAYVDVGLSMESFDVTFVYAYAVVGAYGYLWIVAVAPEGEDGGHVLQLGIDLQNYGVGSFNLVEMNTYALVSYYESWEEEHPRGLAMCLPEPYTEILEIEVAGLEVGEHVVGTLDVTMVEYSHDYD